MKRRHDKNELITVIHAAEHLAMVGKSVEDGMEFFRRHLSEEDLEVALILAAHLQCRRALRAPREKSRYHPW